MVEVVDTAPLRAHVRLLGDILGKIIRDNAGEALFDRVEQIRLRSKEAQDSDTWEALDQLLASLEEGEFLVIARAFSQFLNLANIADQQHTTSVQTEPHFSASSTLQKTLRVLQTKAKDTDIQAAIDKLHIDLVLTAHPTEITRRTLAGRKDGRVAAGKDDVLGRKQAAQVGTSSGSHAPSGLNNDRLMI